MKSIFVTAATAAMLLTSCSERNPLMEESRLPYGAPQFDKIKSEHYKPALEESITKARAEIDAIINNPEAPTFDNTILAMEQAGRDLNRVAGLFFNIKEANTDDILEQTAADITPMLTEYSLYVSMNQKLFERVKAVYEQRENLGLDALQAKLLEKTYKSFERNGANLPDDMKAEYGKLAEELSLASLQFGKNSLDGTNAYILHITDEAKLCGLPEFVREAGAEEAKARNLEGWVFTLQAPSYGPFMQYSADRELRKQMWEAANTVCTSGEFDNRGLVKDIVNKRLRSANILGYETYADYVLAENMAKNKETVETFLNDLLVKTLPFGKEEVRNLEKYAKGKGLEGRMMPWDFSYYAEMYKHEMFNLNDEILKPYFRLENVESAVFGLANRLYGITITPTDKFPTYNPDVKVFEVKDKDGSFLSLLYVDYFPRANKRSGAWMTEFRGASIVDGVEERPIINLVLNFSKPTATAPSLLSFYEVTVLLHEFGHGLHGIFAKGPYGSLNGTNVTRDFVELPSQIMENWAYEPEFLSSFAKHYQTGEVIPAELIEKIVESKNYNSGYAQIRQLTFGLCDMAWHTITEPFEGDVLEFESEAIRPTMLLPEIKGTSVSTKFGHIFTGGYASGYYSYKWAEVLEADAFSLFKEKGIFNTEVAESFRENILSKGCSQDADVIYRNFRGRDPQPEALMKKLGLVK